MVSICLHACLRACVPACLPACLPVGLSVCLPVRLSVCLSYLCDEVLGVIEDHLVLQNLVHSVVQRGEGGFDAVRSTVRAPARLTDRHRDDGGNMHGGCSGRLTPPCL